MRTLLTIIFILLLKFASAQDPLTYRSADSLTYSQFASKNYIELRKTVRQALKQDIDFYYLRMRMGISYYDRKDYDSAIPHFSKALEMNPANEAAREYYYFSLLFSGRYDDAEDFSSNFESDFKQRLGIKETITPFREVSVGAGAILNDNFEKNNNLVSGSNEQIALSTFGGNTYFANIMLKNKFSPRFSMFNGITFFQSNASGVLKHPMLQNNAKPRQYSNTFFQYNLLSVYSFPIGVRLGAAIGYYNEKSYLMSYDPEATNPPGLVLDLPYNHNAFSASVLAGLRINRFDFFVTGSMSNLLSKKQKQADVGVTFFPLGNQSLFMVTKAAYLDNSGDEGIILSQKIGGKISKNAWAEIEVEAGNMEGYMKSTGFVAFNTADPVFVNGGISVQLFLGDLTITPAFGLQLREGEIFTISGADQEVVYSEAKYWNKVANLSIKLNL